MTKKILKVPFAVFVSVAIALAMIGAPMAVSAAGSAGSPVSININTVSIGDGSGLGYTFDGTTLVITDNGHYNIIGTGVAIDRGIRVTAGRTANITLNNVNLDRNSDTSKTDTACAFNLTGATVNLTLAGSNTLISGNERAGLQVPSGAALIIGGGGSLAVFGGGGSAGIGGSKSTGDDNISRGGNIIINSGTISALCGLNGAGIGGGYNGSGGNITIYGGSVTVKTFTYSQSDGAGIGGGVNGSGGNITIYGGIVDVFDDVTSTGSGAGIGGGVSGAGGNIVICGGTVTANGSNPGTASGGAGIGGGGGLGSDGGSAGNITIAGTANVTAKGGKGNASVGAGAGIGGGGGRNSGGSAGTIIISSALFPNSIGGAGLSLNGAAIGSGGSSFSAGTVQYGTIVTTHTIAATATPSAGGTITASGSLQVINGANQLLTFTAKANADYAIESVTLDGVPQTLDAAGSFTYFFVNVTAPHTVAATFKSIAPLLENPTPGAVTDDSGKPAAGTVDFAILPASAFTVADKVWTGRSIQSGFTVKATYTESGKSVTKTLRPGTDYTLSKPGANKNIGAGSITVTGKGTYKGTKALTFKIVPTKPSKLKLKAGARSLKITFNKVSKTQKITTYKVEYRLQGKANWSSKTIRVKLTGKSAKAKTASITLKKLKSKKSYQVRVHAYKGIYKGLPTGVKSAKAK